MKRTPAIVTPDDMPPTRSWLAQLGGLCVVLLVAMLAPIILREENKHRRQTMNMKLSTAVMLTFALIIGIAWLALPRGKVETVTGAAPTHVALPGQASMVLIEHQGGGLCYYGYNMNTNQWATAYTATNCIPISNAQHRIERRGINRLSFRGATATTSTIHWAAF